ncbi:multidrug resistance ABC transporter, permease protein [Campylobacter blaseri]|uniref:ABC transporter permease n=1 Tax=Campylobacter blaseri TaxID=2042961 RepID=A0A2P8R3H6_9BACT|nr:ABC transporter permease [Campylobacter blaseri]PSM53044.1 ABC transporter permease [Campylobacter blaseri]PSM54511.1 ABC transporter permease [Campylobacter blaseri]QKF85241.1 multidrug resistance ABC transporter, permease protein [Campylobacter blaseri]
MINNFKFRRFKAIATKETLQVFRDPSSIIIAFVLPMILLFLMGYAVSLDSKNIKFGIISHQNSKTTNDLISNFIASKYFDTQVGKDKEKFMQNIQNNNLKAILIIDENFKKNQKLQLLIDGSEPNTAGLIAKYSSEIIKNWALDKNIANDIKINSTMWFNTPVSSRYFLIPGAIAVIMTLIGTLLTALVIAREWERGTMEALLATPVSMVEIIAGKLVPYIFLALSSMLICFLVAFFWYEIPFRGSILMLMLLSVVYLFPSLGIGLLISTMAKNQFVVSQASIIVGFLPAFLISGAIFEISNMPNFVQYLSYIIHARYFVSSLQTIFLVGNIYEIFLMDILGMLLIGAFFFFLMFRRVKRSLD